MKTIKYFFTICTFFLLSINSFAQDRNLDDLMRSRNEYYFSVEITNKADIQALNQIVNVDKVTGNTIICYANNSQYNKLIQAGYQTTLLTPPSMVETAKMWEGGNRATYDWDSYPTYSAYEQMMNEYNAYSNCNVMTLGTLSSGRKIMVAHINNGQSAGKPKFLYSSTMHGDETTGWIMMLRLIDVLLTSNDARIQNLVDSLDIYICPLANPDGTFHGGNNTVNGATRANGNGVDLNRNYPDFDDGAHPDGLSYQNETQWFMQLAQDYIFTMSANYHGGAEVINYPWDTYQPLHVDDAWWRLVSTKYASSCQSMNSNYTTDENNGITNGYAWYTITGSRQDYMNYYAECREVTIECSTTKCPSGSQLPSFWNYSYNAILGYMEDCLDGIHGIVTNSQTGQPIQGVKVKVLNHDDDNYSTVTSHEAGDYHRVIKGGTYTVQYTKDGYCPETRTITVADGGRIDVNVQLTPGDCVVADFTANHTIITTGQTVNFTDMSFGNITSRNWQFEGGTPTTSTQTNPTVTYNTPGVYTVTLTVNNSTESDTETKVGYITVAESGINMSNTTIHACNTLFYDHKGPNQNYSNNQNMTTVIYPEDETATLQVIFSDFATESGYDFLYIYQGSSANNYNLIGQYSGTDSPGTVTANTPGGALTFKFTSDQYENAAGWVALIRCIPSTEPLTVQATANPTNITLGQSSQLTATAQGGTEQYTYSWQPATGLNNANIATPVATPTQTTTYTVTVNDGNTTATASVTVTVSIPALTVQATANPSLIMQGQSSQLTATAAGGTGQYTYSWQPTTGLNNANIATPVASPTQTTNYTVTVTDGNSTATASVTVTVSTQPIPLTVQATATPDSITLGQSTQLTAVINGGTGQYTYLWQPTESLDNAEISNPIATPSTTTTYTVIVNDGTDIVTASVTVVVIQDGIGEESISYAIYPNPANQELNIEVSGETESYYRMYNNMGQEVARGIVNGKTTLGLEQFVSGIYFIEISNNNTSTTHKIVIR